MGDRIVDRQAAVAAGTGGDAVALRMQQQQQHQQQQQQQQSTNVENQSPASSAVAPLATGREGKLGGRNRRALAPAGYCAWILVLGNVLSMFFPGIARRSGRAPPQLRPEITYLCVFL